MLYELIAIVRPGNVAEVKEIARNAGTLILRSNGVVRGITNWGPFQLPKPTVAHQVKHHSGHHFILRFDASVAAQQAVSRSLRLDPRMIRHSMVKMASRLGGDGGNGTGVTTRGTESVEGKADWMVGQDWRDGDAAMFMGQDRRARDVERLRGLEEVEERLQKARVEKGRTGEKEEMVEVL